MAAAASTDIAFSMPYFRLEESISTPRYRWNCFDRGSEPFVILQWVHSGEGIYENSNGAQRVPKDHAFLAITPEHSSYYYPPNRREPWIFSWFNWYGAISCELFSKFQTRFGPVIPLSSRGAAAAALRRLADLATETLAPERAEVSLQSYAFALEWWQEASTPASGDEKRLDRALQFCRQYFREPLGVKEIAHEAGMSREHFTRLFVEKTGSPPATFLRGLRVKEACALLRETELPLLEVAMRSGFCSTRHLIRTFQRLYRLGPTEYRRRKNPPPRGSPPKRLPRHRIRAK